MTTTAARRAFLAATAGMLATPLAAQFPLTDPRLRTTTQGWKVQDGRMMIGYFALPAKARGRLPAIILIHDDAGLDDATRALARRIALEGFIAIAPDFLTPGKGTPANPEAARTAIAALYPPQTLHAAQMTLHWLRYHRYTTGRVAAIGRGWGGALAERVAAVSADQLAAVIASDIPPEPASPISIPSLHVGHIGDDADWNRSIAFLKEQLI